MQARDWYAIRAPLVAPRLCAAIGGAPEERAAGPSDNELQRSVGVVRIVLEGSERGTRIAHVFQRYPLRVMFPRTCSSEVEQAVLVNASGGVAGGDRLEFAITALPNASAAVTSQAAEKVYRALSEAARISTRLKVSEAAKLAWLPQETIVFNRARLSRETWIDLVSGAELLALEWLVFGRTAHGEELAAGHLNDSWRVRIDGRLAWADSFRVTDGMFPRLRSRALLSSSKAIATLIFFGPHPNRRLEFFRDLLPSPDCRFAATLVSGLLVARFAADRSSDLRRVLRSLLQEFDREFGPGPFRVPKMWSC
jgi:urease accessory protein